MVGFALKLMNLITDLDNFVGFMEAKLSHVVATDTRSGLHDELLFQMMDFMLKMMKL